MLSSKSLTEYCGYNKEQRLGEIQSFRFDGRFEVYRSIDRIVERLCGLFLVLKIGA